MVARHVLSRHGAGFAVWLVFCYPRLVSIELAPDDSVHVFPEHLSIWTPVI
jgi:hypothetical protein